GALSLSRTVPVAVPRVMTAFDGFASDTVNARVGSATWSPSTWTVIDFSVSPGTKVSTPLAETTAAGPAETLGSVAHPTVIGRDDGPERVTGNVAARVPLSPSTTVVSAMLRPTRRPFGPLPTNVDQGMSTPQPS